MHSEHQTKPSQRNSMNEPRIACKLCGKFFAPKRFWQRFCCKEHREQYWGDKKKRDTILEKRIENIEKQIGINK